MILSKNNQNSMAYWWPKIKDLNIPMPKTEIIRLFDKSEMYNWVDGGLETHQEQIANIRSACRRMGNPAFLRSEFLSVKHNWNTTCYFDENKDSLINHLTEIINFSAAAFLPFKDMIVRQYILMKTLFKAFIGNMPVNEEIRVFVRDGKYQCSHWYWIKDAIQKPFDGVLPDNWESLIDEAEAQITYNEIILLKSYAEMIGQEFEGYWSIDFCKTAEDKWVMIDMALGKDSWHNKKCQNIFNK